MANILIVSKINIIRFVLVHLHQLRNLSYISLLFLLWIFRRTRCKFRQWWWSSRTGSKTHTFALKCLESTFFTRTLCWLAWTCGSCWISIVAGLTWLSHHERRQDYMSAHGFTHSHEMAFFFKVREWEFVLPSSCSGNRDFNLFKVFPNMQVSDGQSKEQSNLWSKEDWK